MNLPDENVFGHRKKLSFIREQIARFIDSHPGERVKILDVGCSNGQHVTIHLGDFDAEILAIDTHAQSIGYAKEHNPFTDKIEFRCERVEQLPQEDKFDIALLADILE
ncbi:MAG TPA: methyltransferase domain-containing protein, partial [Firmicutes bacterium]|nr:methyltransferase domain-containing protein [Bacillota bacterium]